MEDYTLLNKKRCYLIKLTKTQGRIESMRWLYAVFFVLCNHSKWTEHWFSYYSRYP